MSAANAKDWCPGRRKRALRSADRTAIKLIVDRAGNMLGAGTDTQSLAMDLECVHTRADGPLDLSALAGATDFNLMHDVLGINRHLNRMTGRLMGHFVPRYARKAVAS